MCSNVLNWCVYLKWRITSKSCQFSKHSLLFWIIVSGCTVACRVLLTWPPVPVLSQRQSIALRPCFCVKFLGSCEPSWFRLFVFRSAVGEWAVLWDNSSLSYDSSLKGPAWAVLTCPLCVKYNCCRRFGLHFLSHYISETITMAANRWAFKTTFIWIYLFEHAMSCLYWIYSF